VYSAKILEISKMNDLSWNITLGDSARLLMSFIPQAYEGGREKKGVPLLRTILFGL